MAAVTFTATRKIDPRTIGVKEKKAKYVLQLPDASSGWLAAGLAWNLSADFDVITEAVFSGCKGYTFELSGTATTAGDGHTGSTNKILGYYSDYNASGDGALIAIPDATDLSGVTALNVTVYGY